MKLTLGLLVCVAMITASASLDAQVFPLPTAAPNTTAMAGTAPFVVPNGVTQTLMFDRNTLNTMGLPASFSDWDMITFDATGRYVFVPSEAGSGAGVFRYDLQTNTFVNLMVGNDSGVRSNNPMTWNPNNDDFVRFDPCSLTPWNSVITGEETTGGRLFEVVNATDAAGPFNVQWRSAIAAVAHEGLRFDEDGVLYYVDEDNSGCIYKFVPTTPGDLSAGQNFVLVVNAYAGVPSQNWNTAANLASTRVGAATWVPLTDINNNPLTVQNPFVFVTVNSGRIAADELNGTPYGRPEDVVIGRLANGNEALYFTATSENSVYAVELVSSTTAVVHLFLSRNTTDEATGNTVGTQLNAPDNLEVDAWGNIYVIEDQTPGDVWKARDLNNDGVAESMGRFISLGVGGSEPTGFIQNPNDPYRFIVAVQHPSSNNDAVWEINTRTFPGSPDTLEFAAGVNRPANINPGEFVKNAKAGDVVELKIDSPTGTYAGALYYLAFNFYVTGNRPVSGLADVWLDPATAVVVVNPVPSLFPALLPSSGATYVTLVPPGLASASALFQAAAASMAAVNGFLALTDAHELNFIP